MAKEGNIHAGHRERLKKRLARERTLEGFEPHEILEMLLYYAIPQGDTNPLAHRLIDYFGDLPSVFRASTEELLQIKGVGAHTASLLTMIDPLMSALRRMEQPPILIVNTSQKACELAAQLLQDAQNEQVAIILLDPQGRVMKTAIVAEGTSCGVELPIPKIMEWVVRIKPASMILAHNHPGGKPDPSYWDDRCTRDLMMAMRPMDVDVSDHIIVGETKLFSYRREDRLEGIAREVKIRTMQPRNSYSTE